MLPPSNGRGIYGEIIQRQSIVLYYSSTGHCLLHHQLNNQRLPIQVLSRLSMSSHPCPWRHAWNFTHAEWLCICMNVIMRHSMSPYPCPWAHPRAWRWRGLALTQIWTDIYRLFLQEKAEIEMCLENSTNIVYLLLLVVLGYYHTPRWTL